MKPEHRRERTAAGRHNLRSALRFVRQATVHLEDVAENGSKAQLLEAVALWEDAIRQGQEARKACVELLDEEVEAWIKD